VTLTARQGSITLDTAAGPVSNALLFGYRLQRGTASNGQTSGDGLYPAPTLNVFPGETLIVHLENAMTGLTIRDYVDPTWPATGDDVPLLPPALRDSPYNNHVHGIHTSPQGGSDNVLIDIPAGSNDTYTYQIPRNHPQGLYWYHSHRHMLTNPQVYRGLVGMLVIGRADGGIPVVAQKNLPVRTMALQYNYVFNRAGGQSVLNNVYWPSMVSTLKKPAPAQLADGTYRPLLSPSNFLDSAKGTTYLTAWYAGPLSVNNNRGVYQYLPTNLQSFRSTDGRILLTAEPSSGTGTTVPFTPGQPLGAYTSFVDTSTMEPAVRRTLHIDGGFANELANEESPAAFAYQFNGNQFPYIPLLQPRLDTVEQWNFVNSNNDQHPIHIHVNDYQVVDYLDPVLVCAWGVCPSVRTTRTPLHRRWMRRATSSPPDVCPCARCSRTTSVRTSCTATASTMRTAA